MSKRRRDRRRRRAKEKSSSDTAPRAADSRVELVEQLQQSLAPHAQLERGLALDPEQRQALLEQALPALSEQLAQTIQEQVNSALKRHGQLAEVKQVELRPKASGTEPMAAQPGSAEESGLAEAELSPEVQAESSPELSPEVQAKLHQLGLLLKQNLAQRDEGAGFSAGTRSEDAAGVPERVYANAGRGAAIREGVASALGEALGGLVELFASGGSLAGVASEGAVSEQEEDEAGAEGEE